MAMFRNKPSNSYDGVPTSEPEIVVAVATSAREEKTRNIDVTSTDDFFDDKDDIIAVFDYDRECLRNNQFRGYESFYATTFCLLSYILFVRFLSAEQTLVTLLSFLVPFCVGFSCYKGLFRSFFALMIAPPPVYHTAVTTSGVRFAYEPSGSVIGGGGEHNVSALILWLVSRLFLTFVLCCRLKHQFWRFLLPTLKKWTLWFR